MTTLRSEPISNLAVRYLGLDQLKPDPRNPRQHSDQQIRQIVKSMQSFGNNVPILVDRDYKIIAGHGRFLAAKQLGLVTVPIVMLEHLTPAQSQAFAIADNRLTENSSWDEKLLGEIFADLSLHELDFSLDATGFNFDEIAVTVDALNPPQSSGWLSPGQQGTGTAAGRDRLRHDAFRTLPRTWFGPLPRP